MTHTLSPMEIADIFRNLGEVEGMLRIVEHHFTEQESSDADRARLPYTRNLLLVGNVIEKLKIEFCQGTGDDGLNSNFRRALET